MKNLLSNDLMQKRQVHVWYAFLEAFQDAALHACERALSHLERERWQTISHVSTKETYLIAHGFLRLVLSHYSTRRPRDWEFLPNAYGKPEIDPPAADCHALQFNLSHTNGLVTCAVAHGCEIGVDAEDTTRGGRGISDALVERCLSRQERETLVSIQHDQRQAAFFDYWTLKEAYLKARGVGLALPLDAITVEWPSQIPHEGPAALSFGAAIDDVPHQWQLERFQVSPWHKLAMAVRIGSAPRLPVVLHHFPEKASKEVWRWVEH